MFKLFKDLFNKIDIIYKSSPKKVIEKYKSMTNSNMLNYDFSYSNFIYCVIEQKKVDR
jgi:hypothetical protein